MAVQVHSTIDMKGNRIINCPDVFECVDITLEEYNRLKSEGLLDETKFYNIIDDADACPIDDSKISAQSGWSSQKISEELAKTSAGELANILTIGSF